MKRSILALSQFIKQILHSNVYFSLQRIFLSKAGTSLQSMTTFHTQVRLGQHVYLHNSCGLQQKRPFQESRQVPPAVKVAKIFSSPLLAAGFSLVLPRFVLPRTWYLVETLRSSLLAKVGWCGQSLKLAERDRWWT